MLRQQLSQHDCLALFDRDRSTWAEVKFYPDTVTCRRMLRFADWAANFPQCYYAARRNYEAPELSFRELALMAGMPESTFRSRLKAVYWIDDPQDFSDLELDCYGVEIPQLPCRTSRTGQTSLTYKYAIALADFAAADRIRWECIRAYYSWEVAQADLGRIYGISQSTVSRYLETLSTIKGGINYEYL